MKKLFVGIAAAIAVASSAVAATYDLSSVVSDLTLEDGDVVTGALASNRKISIEDGAKVRFDGVTIIADKEDEDFDNCTWAGVTCLGDATILLEGANEICSFAATYPGIHVPENKTLTIDGEGSLSVTSLGYAAGIGGGDKLPCGNIFIDGGSISATGAEAPGIGGGYKAACGNIVISGGVVTSIGGDSSAGIGSTFEGSCGDITIGGGVVTASGGFGSAGIGSAYEGSCGTVTICGGKVTATGGEYAAGIGSGSRGNCSEVQICVSKYDEYPRVVATCGDNCNNPIGAGNGGNNVSCSVDGRLPSVIQGNTRIIESVIDLSSLSNEIVVHSGQVIAGTLAGRYKVSIDEGATVVVRGVNINTNGTTNANSEYAGLTCEGDATIILEGDSIVNSFHREYPGIYVPDSYTLTIQGDGSLESSGGSWAAGIGGGYGGELACGDIVIDVDEGCRISAKGGGFSAGIGGGFESNCGAITIYDGTIKAVGGGGAAGIGGSNGNEGCTCGDITIYGGNIEATGGDRGAGIGSGNIGSCGDITIYGGYIAATGGVYAAGIGTGDGEYDDSGSYCDSIVINGGEITATGGLEAAGIGTGKEGECYNGIEINGGEITAAGGSNAAGVGTGREGACEGGIEINGGEITATGGDYGAGIGSGDGRGDGSDCGSIVINGGAVYATGGSGAAGIGMGWKGTCDCVKINLGISCVDATCGYGCMTPISAGDEGECDDDSVEVASCLTDELSQDGKERIIECGEGYAAWVVEVGLSGDDAEWDATPDIWGGWENAFVYLYGEDIVDGYATLIDISIDEDGKPVITTAPEEWREDVTATVVGSSSLSDWSNPVILEQDGDEWTLPTGAKANFFRLILTY